MDLTQDTRTPTRPADPGPRHARRGIAVMLALAVGALGAVVGAQGATAAPPSIDTSAWYELESWRSRLVLGVDGASTADGAAVVQEASTGAASHRVRFLDSGSGYYRVAFAHSGKVVTIGGSSSSLATQATDSGDASQQFSVAAGSSGRIKLVNRASGLALQVVDSSKVSGARWNQAGDTNANNQQITLRKVTGTTPEPTASPTATASPSPTVTSSPTPTVTSSPTPTQTTTPSGSWPSATSQQKVSSTIQVSGTLDGRLVRYYGISSGDQGESQPPIFQLADGAVLKNVIIGTGAGDGVHCTGTCTLQNVWWEDVGEDAATLKGTSTSQVMTVTGGGAKGASDKVFQHNGPGTFVITGGFQVTGFGKLYRSCGNCSQQYARTVKVDGVQVTTPGKSLVGINSNLGDKATLRNVTIVGDSSRKISICDEYKGVTSGEPSKVRSGPSAACGYSTSDITYR